jgi:hypothetical protein
MLDVDRLEKPRLRGGRFIARCPACAELGADRSCEHLCIDDDGRGPFGCVVNPGPAGEAHRKRIFELVGVQDRFRPLPRCAPATPKPMPRIPDLRPLTIGEMAAVATLRGWHWFAGLELLTQRGLLWHGEVFDDKRTWPAWTITDNTRRNAQARRLDGLPWSGIGSAKAKSLPSSDPSWPIGAAEVGNRPFVLLCEGQPDFCSSLLVAWFEGLPVDLVAPICMTGAGNSIHTDALPSFAGKHVRIAVHDDNAGRKAGERWAGQLYRAGAARVDWFDFSGLTKRDGQPVKDLADFAAQLHPEKPSGVSIFDAPAFLKKRDLVGERFKRTEQPG